MKEPSFLEYLILVMGCLVMGIAGLFLLSRFGSLFRNSIRNEILRKNIAAWLVIFCISNAIIPMSGGFFFILNKYGILWAIGSQLISTTIMTLVVFNLTWLVASNKRLKRLSFLQHNLLIISSLIIVTALINIPVTYEVYGYDTRYMGYAVVSSVYVSGATGIVYIIISYLDIERKRRFEAKELELSRMRELKSKAELDALHSKVNPHFLYNALNSIADLSITDGKKARRMTIALADLFRYSINYSQNNFSTVNDEVAMTEVYLQIEKIRFEDQLNYKVQVQEGTGHYLIPRFVLQPLVENAVKHGLKITGSMTEITLDVSCSEQGMLITVADNGPAFPEELVPGYGVKSVYDKFDLLFPGEYEIHFANQPGKQVEIHIAKLMKNEPAV